MSEIVGRFLPEGLNDIQPSGTWQWDGPLVIFVADSSDCPAFNILRERRWTEILVEYSVKSRMDFKIIVEDLIQHYNQDIIAKKELKKL